MPLEAHRFVAHLRSGRAGRGDLIIPTGRHIVPPAPNGEKTMTDLAKKLHERHSDYMIATGDDLLWLAEQLCEWPHRRVHPDRTMSDQFLRHSAAQTMLAQAAALEREPDEAMVERVTFAIIKGSAGLRAAQHAQEFQTANWTDALRSARAAIAAMKGGSDD